jgi:hypothetical protein
MVATLILGETGRFSTDRKPELTNTSEEQL